MKKIAMLFMMMICVVNINSQNVVKYVNEMTEKSFFGVDKYLLCSEDGKNGFFIIPSFDYKDIDFPKLNDFTVKGKWENLSCVEGGIMILKFNDDTKITLKNWRDFNCDGGFYFSIKNSDDVEKLYSTPVIKIYIQNGRNSSSFTYDVPEKDQKYFVKVGESVKTGNFPIIKK